MAKDIDNQWSPAPLTNHEAWVIQQGGTERPFSGQYDDFYHEGQYHCRQCGKPLFSSESKFKSGSGWPSFDDALLGAIKRVPEADGRTEIRCASCDGHLGHVFEGEGFTEKNTRYCVNSVSLSFAESLNTAASEAAKAYFAGGCFWGVEYAFDEQAGVLHAVSGYMGGHQTSPSYQQVVAGNTGHLETVEVTYNPNQISYEQLVSLFFTIHNPEQANGQGVDIGPQYLPAVFVRTPEEQRIVQAAIDKLESQGKRVATQIIHKTEQTVFWPAEEYHQDYFKKRNMKPMCHTPK